MAGSVNKVILVGNLGADPEVRTLPSGDKVVNLSVATSESWRDKNSGERKEKTEWHRVVIFNGSLVQRRRAVSAKRAARFTSRARCRPANGRTSRAQEKYSTEVVLQGFNSTLTMLDGRGDNAEGGSAGFSGPPAARSEGRRPAANAPAFESGGMDDDIPF